MGFSKQTEISCDVAERAPLMSEHAGDALDVSRNDMGPTYDGFYEDSIRKRDYLTNPLRWLWRNRVAVCLTILLTGGVVALVLYFTSKYTLDTLLEAAYPDSQCLRTQRELVLRRRYA